MIHNFDFETISIFDIYEELTSYLDTKPNQIFELLRNNFDIRKFIPSTFYNSYYSSLGKNRDIPLEAILSALAFMHLFKIPTTKLLRLLLLICQELRDFCGFTGVLPDEPLISRFKETFEDQIFPPLPWCSS